MEFEASLEILSCLHFVIQLTTLMLVWTVEFSCWLIFVSRRALCCWLSWQLTMETVWWKTADYIVMVAMRNLRVE